MDMGELSNQSSLIEKTLGAFAKFNMSFVTCEPDYFLNKPRQSLDNVPEVIIEDYDAPFHSFKNIYGNNGFFEQSSLNE